MTRAEMFRAVALLHGILDDARRQSGDGKARPILSAYYADLFCDALGEVEAELECVPIPTLPVAWKNGKHG